MSTIYAVPTDPNADALSDLATSSVLNWSGLQQALLPYQLENMGLKVTGYNEELKKDAAHFDANKWWQYIAKVDPASYQKWTSWNAMDPAHAWDFYQSEAAKMPSDSGWDDQFFTKTITPIIEKIEETGGNAETQDQILDTLANDWILPYLKGEKSMPVPTAITDKLNANLAATEELMNRKYGDDWRQSTGGYGTYNDALSTASGVIGDYQTNAFNSMMTSYLNNVSSMTGQQINTANLINNAANSSLTGVNAALASMQPYQYQQQYDTNIQQANAQLEAQEGSSGFDWNSVIPLLTTAAGAGLGAWASGPAGAKLGATLGQSAGSAFASSSRRR